MYPFPSLEWMKAYAHTVADHPQADRIAKELAGRYRFVITPASGLDSTQAYDLVVDDPPSFTARLAGTEPADLTITADYNRWRGLLTGNADFIMSFLMRKIKVDGDIGSIRNRLSDVQPLLDSLQQVATEFRY